MGIASSNNAKLGPWVDLSELSFRIPICDMCWIWVEVPGLYTDGVISIPV